MRIAIIGAGSLGCLFGARLAHAGHDVTLLHYRENVVRKLNENGISVKKESDGDIYLHHTVPATTDASSVGTVDLALVLVKAHQTRQALEQHTDCIGPDTTVLSLQNGIGNYDIIIEFVGEDRALAGVTYQGAVTEQPGIIIHTGDGQSVFGGANSTHVNRATDCLESAEFPIENTDDPKRAIWSKQLISLPIKPVAALTRLTNEELVSNNGLVELMDQIVLEAQRVARAHDIDLPDIDYQQRVREVCRASDGHKSSMLQDVLKERQTEIAAVNGAVVKLAEEEDIKVPANRIVTHLVGGLEQGYLIGSADNNQ